MFLISKRRYWAITGSACAVMTVALAVAWTIRLQGGKPQDHDWLLLVMFLPVPIPAAMAFGLLCGAVRIKPKGEEEP